MIKQSQLYGWEQEPVDERPSEFMHSTHLGFLSSSHSALSTPKVAAAARQPASIAPAVRRDPPNERDKTLSSFAVKWVEGLPDVLWPQHLCALFPRIANRLALCWADAALSERFVERLLVDERGERKGFPLEVAGELARLHAYAVRRRAMI